jgi:glycosyltransferase involved in cell wall biosynthesis
MSVSRTILTQAGLNDPAFVAELPIPVEVGGAQAIRRAAAECDVMLSWGVALEELLGKGKKLPCLCVGIAHGEGRFTREQLAGSRRYLDHVIAVSEAARRGACEGLGVPTTVVANGVDTARLAWTTSRAEMREALGLSGDDFVVGYVGRLSPEKRVRLLLEAVAGLPARFKVLVVGWGPLLGELLETGNRELPGRLVVRTATEYLGDYYRAMDAFCSPSESEGTPMTMLEALFSGVPALMTNVGAVPELIEDRVNGLIVEPRAESIQAGLQRLERNRFWAHGVAEQGRQTAERYGHASRMARQYEETLGRLWAERARG